MNLNSRHADRSLVQTTPFTSILYKLEFYKSEAAELSQSVKEWMPRPAMTYGYDTRMVPYHRFDRITFKLVMLRMITPGWG
ncbi:hypothetical protein Plhal304r1_c002g0009221 [Plasmopara halstedii]